MFHGSLYRDQSTLRQHNTPNPIRLLFVEQFGFNHFLNEEVFVFLDILHECGVNGLRVFGFWPYGLGQEVEPYVRRGSEYDLSQFDERFFDYQRAMVEHALNKGIVVRYELFDRCGLTSSSPGVKTNHPYYQLVQGDRRRFADLSNAPLVDLQKAYIRKVVETLGHFPNLMLGVMNEFKSDPVWHVAISKYVKKLAPHILLSGSEEDSPAADDPSVDLWWCHTGSYDFQTGTPYIREDLQRLQHQIGTPKVLGFSTDGFGSFGQFRETPQDMERLAQAASAESLSCLAMLDQGAYDKTHGEVGKADWANTAAYRALVHAFHPSDLGSEALHCTPVERMYFTHPLTRLTYDGMMVPANNQPGFICFGDYRRFLPQGDALAVFSLKIDNHTKDDAYICILDVVRGRGTEVVAWRLVTRSQFPASDRHVKLHVPFFVKNSDEDYECRVLYLGGASLAVDRVWIVQA